MPMKPAYGRVICAQSIGRMVSVGPRMPSVRSRNENAISSGPSTTPTPAQIWAPSLPTESKYAMTRSDEMAITTPHASCRKLDRKGRSAAYIMPTTAAMTTTTS
ncbi:Uncharacterised protein [Mycolicibacterium gilvum]|uniref:Uncharacterized protein n=1 Tax=Mycolicibacterium gilvum TaxID=1804 RepID=A0A378SIJ4_9MYCO|nr:hypothetical protein [Mycolicibacterium gilvum]STZ42523.1 Uncharacterised protein [Mycolicibacterium gilvum]